MAVTKPTISGWEADSSKSTSNRFPGRVSPNALFLGRYRPLAEDFDLRLGAAVTDARRTF